jgi:hypothetical protein
MATDARLFQDRNTFRTGWAMNVRSRIVNLVLIGLALILLLVVVAPHFIDDDKLRRLAAREVQSATGHDLAIEGEIDFRLLPSPRLRAQTIRLSERRGDIGAIMTAESLEISFSIGGIFAGNRVIASLRVNKPVIFVERSADGRWNWPTSDVAPIRGESKDLRLRDILLSDGQLIWRDQKRNISFVLDKLNAELSLAMPGGPLKGHWQARYRDIPLKVTLDRAMRRPGQSTALSFTADFGEGDVMLAIEGQLVPQGPAMPHLTGKFVAKSENLGEMLQHLWNIRSVELSGIPAELRGRLAATDERAMLTDAVLDMDGERMDGRIVASYRDAPSLSAQLHARSFNLDKILAKSREHKTHQPDIAPMPAVVDVFRLPQLLTGGFQLSADNVIFRGAPLSGVSLAAQLTPPELRFSEVKAGLPGNARLSAEAVISRHRPDARLVGNFTLISEYPAQFVDWLFKRPDSPTGMHEVLALKSGFNVHTDLVQLFDANMTWGRSQLSASLSCAFPSRKRFALDINATHIQIDRFTELLFPNAKTFTVSDLPDWFGVRPDAATFDAQIAIKADEYSFGDLDGGDLRLTANLRDGVFRLGDETSAALAHGRLQLSGQLTQLASNPHGRFEVRMTDVDGKALETRTGYWGFTLLDDAPINMLAWLEVDGAGCLPACRAFVNADAPRGGLNGTFNLASQGAGEQSARSTSELSEKSVVPEKSVDATLEIRTARSQALAAAVLRYILPANMAFPDALPDAREKRVPSRRGRAAPGEMDAALLRVEMNGSLPVPTLTLILETPQLSGTLRGSVEDPFGTRHINANLLLETDDLGGLLPDDKFTHREKIANVPARLAAFLERSPDGMRTREMALGMGRAAFTGELHLRGGENGRPHVDLTLNTEHLAFDLPPSTAEMEKSLRDWRQPFADRPLLPVDGRLEISAAQLSLGGLQLNQARAQILATANQLGMENFEARSGGGNVSLRASLLRPASSSARQATLNVRTENADIDNLLSIFLSEAGIDGPADIELQMGGEGRSLAMLLASLKGGGRIKLGPGDLHGLDLKAFRDALVQEKAVNAQALRTLATGKTAYRLLAGDIHIDGGVARLDKPIFLLAEESHELKLTVTPAAWRAALEAGLFLHEGMPDAPAIRITAAGPLQELKRTVDTGAFQNFLATRQPLNPGTGPYAGAGETAASRGLRQSPGSLRPVSTPLPSLRP